MFKGQHKLKIMVILISIKSYIVLFLITSLILFRSSPNLFTVVLNASISWSVHLPLQRNLLVYTVFLLITVPSVTNAPYIFFYEKEAKFYQGFFSKLQ